MWIVIKRWYYIEEIKIKSFIVVKESSENCLWFVFVINDKVIVNWKGL